MSKGYSNLIRATRILQKPPQNRECRFCEQPATRWVVSMTSFGPACDEHARNAKQLGYDIVPSFDEVK